jgi:phage minor structural protein
MIKCFGQADTSFSSNGDIIIQPFKALVHKTDNGDFYLELECSLDYLEYVIPNNIIVCNTPQGEQAFRIYHVSNTRRKITAKCLHIFYDSSNYLIADSYVVNKNCNDALDHLNNSTDNTSPFTTLSDVQTVNSFRCVRQSLNEAIQTVLERWGGHLVRDNWSIKIMDSIGQDNGVTIRYKKNLKEITVDYDWSEVVTKLMPVGKDGLLLEDLYVSSDTQYEIPFTKTMTFDQEINEDDFKDDDGNLNEDAYHQALLDDLRVQGQTYVDAHCIPSVNYTLKANMEKITDVGDTVEVIDERLGINLMTSVLSFVYDCILDKYVEIEFGNATPQLSNLMSTMESNMNTAIAENNQTITIALSAELQEAQDKIWGALGNSYCIYEGDQILVVDSLPKETARNVLRINSAGIAFSQTGINGAFTSAWTIDGTLNMQAINVINLTADLIKGGTLKLGSNLNSSGQLEVYDEANNLIAELNNEGLKMFGVDGSYLLMNTDVGFAGFDRLGNKIYWVAKDEFHMKKSVVEEEITLCSKMRFIPIETTVGNTIVNDGIGLVSVLDTSS